MAEVKVLSANGNQMVAEAYRQAEPDALFAYPITPQTTIVENFAKYVANGRVHTEYVTVESEHSSMSACIGSCAAGARTFTATSSQGLAYMVEELPIASGMRLPIILANANRAISAPININCDHSDVMLAANCGWLMFFAENAQEAYDNTLIAIRSAEDRRVLLPAITALDGFITTHAMERCELMDDAIVADFVGERDALYPLLDTANPVAMGSYTNAEPHYEVKKSQRAAMEAARAVIKEYGDKWAQVSGRAFDMVDCYECDDAEYVVVVIGSCAGNVRHVARQLRAQGKKVGVARIRVYRPFPAAELVQALGSAKAVAVLDRSETYGGQMGPLALETAAALFKSGKSLPLKNYLYGLGGPDITLADMERVYSELEGVAAGSVDTSIAYLGAKKEGE